MTTHEEIIATAKEVGAYRWDKTTKDEPPHTFHFEQLKRFYAIAFEHGRQAEREECAKACESERVEDTGYESDRAYNIAIKHCASAIRARSTK